MLLSSFAPGSSTEKWELLIASLQGVCDDDRGSMQETGRGEGSQERAATLATSFLSVENDRHLLLFNE